eukprot:m.113489 g.113489  ORF g.113489 m.113489 type:complete len:281 (-) comp28274_c1_seq3:307-1149(-)
MAMEVYLESVADLTATIPWLDRFTVARFFVARQEDPKAAEEMLRETVEWRQRIHLDDIMSEWGEPEKIGADKVPTGFRRQPKTERAKLADNHSYCGRIKATTNAGAPIVVQRVGRADLYGAVREELPNLMMHSWCFMLEDAFLACRAASLEQDRMVKAAMIIDLDGMGFSVMRHMSIIKSFAKIGTHFAEITRTVTIINAPMFFAGMWKVVSPLLPAASRAKVSILGRSYKEALEKHADVDIELLPKFLGGTGSDEEVLPAHPVPVGAGAQFKEQAPSLL